MKIILIIAVLASISAPVMSCDKYNDVLNSTAVRRNSEVMPPKSVTDQMPSDKLQIPSDARDVSWDKEGKYWELSYETGHGLNKVEVDVYFDGDGKWVMTRKDIRMKDVPSYIKKYVTSSPEYSGAAFLEDDADFIERPSGNSYLLEVIVGRAEIDLEVAEDGKITEVR